MTAHAERRKRRRRTAVAAAMVILLGVLGIVSILWRQSETARHEAAEEALRAEASKLVALGRVEIDRYPSATLAYARRSLELADTFEARRLALEALWRGPTARILPLEVASWSAEFSPDGHWLATFPFSENVLLFPDDGGPPRVFGGHVPPAAPPGLAFTPDGNALLTNTPGDPRVRMLSVPEGRELRWLAPELPGGDPEAFFWVDVGWVPEGPLFSVREKTEPDPVVRLELVPVDGRPSRVGSLLREPGVSYFPDHSGSLLVLDRGQRILVRPLVGPATTAEREVARMEGGRVRYPFFSPRGDSLAIVQDGGRLTLWPLDQGRDARRVPRVLRMEKPDIHFFPTFDADGSRIVWGSSAKGTVSLWRLDGPPDADPVVLRRAVEGPTKRGVFHPDGDWLAVANEQSLAFWSVRQPQPFVLRGHESAAGGVHYTPDSRWLVSCGYQGDSIRLWPLDPQAGALQTIGYEGVVNCSGLAVGPDGERILVGGSGGARVIPLTGGEPRVLTGPPPDGVIYGVAFDASGRRVAAATFYSQGPPKMLRVWDLDSGAPPRELSLIPPGESGDDYAFGVDELAFTPDGDLVAAGLGGIRRFDFEDEAGTGDWIWELDREWRALMGLSRDRQLMIAVATPRFGAEWLADHPLVFFDLAAGTRRAITTHGNRVAAVALDPSGETIVTGDAQGAVRVGPADGGEPHLLLGHSVAVSPFNNPLAISPDGRWIASAAGDEIRLWPMPDVTKPPLHTLPLDELLAKLHELTNVEVVADEASPGGHKIEIGPFPGWKNVPTWFTPAHEATGEDSR